MPLNAYETYITLQMENVTVNLPDHLFTTSPSHQPKLRWYDMQVELRSVQQYTDVFLSLSPVTLTVPLAGGGAGLGMGGRWESGERERGWNEKETSVQMVGFVLSYHSSKGDPPRSIVYRSSMKVMLDELNAQLLPGQLACLLSSLSAITQQYADAADYNQPPVSTSTLMPTIDSNNDTLELITAKKQLSSYLQDQLNTALADNTIELAVGCIKLNLLHPPPPKATGSAARLSLTRLLLSEGAQLSSSTLITPLAHSKRTVEIPTIELSHLVANDGDHPAHYSFPFGGDNHSSPSYSPSHPGGSSSHWVSLAEFRCGALLTIADQRADCVSTMRKQQDFIYSQMHQEAAGDENEQYSWHEQNATKVPYMYNDELAAAGGAGAGAMPLFSVTQAVSEGYGLGAGGVAAGVGGGGIGGGGMRCDMNSPMLGLRGLDQARHHAAVGLGEIHTPQLHSPELQSPSHLFSPPMNSPLPRDASHASIRSDLSGGPPPLLPMPSLADRLRSHAQKRSVQIARSGLVVPRPSHHSVVDRPTPPRQPTATDGSRPTGVTFHRRPSLMASVAFQLDPKPPMLRRLSRRGKSKLSLLTNSHYSERKEEHSSGGGRDKDGEDEQKQLEPAVTVEDEDDDETEEANGEMAEVSQTSFESCQSFSRRVEQEARELSRLASSSPSRDAGDETVAGLSRGRAAAALTSAATQGQGGGPALLDPVALSYPVTAGRAVAVSARACAFRLLLSLHRPSAPDSPHSATSTAAVPHWLPAVVRAAAVSGALLATGRLAQLCAAQACQLSRRLSCRPVQQLRSRLRPLTLPPLPTPSCQWTPTSLAPRPAPTSFYPPPPSSHVTSTRWKTGAGTLLPRWLCPTHCMLAPLTSPLRCRTTSCLTTTTACGPPRWTRCTASRLLRVRTLTLTGSTWPRPTPTTATTWTSRRTPPSPTRAT